MLYPLTDTCPICRGHGAMLDLDDKLVGTVVECVACAGYGLVARPSVKDLEASATEIEVRVKDAGEHVFAAEAVAVVEEKV